MSRTQFENEIEARLRRAAEHVRRPGPIPAARVAPAQTAHRHKPAILLGAAVAVVLLVIGATALSRTPNTDRVTAAVPSSSDTAGTPRDTRPEPIAGSAAGTAPTSPTGPGDNIDTTPATAPSAPAPTQPGSTVTTTPDPAATSSPPTPSTDPGAAVTASTPDPRSTVFAEPIGAVMIIDDGTDGVTIVDLDSRVATRLAIGGRAGDQPYRLWLTGGSLVTGWGRISVTPLSNLNTRDLADATIFVPSNRDGEVWLIDYPGGRIGSGTPTYRLMTVDGEVLVEAEGLSPRMGFPTIGFGTGLAIAGGAGVVLWSPDGSTRTVPKTSSSVFISDVSEQQIAWCDGRCTQLRITDHGSFEDFAIDPPHGEAGFAPRAARFSPDGETLAAITLTSVDSGPQAAHLLLIDTATGRIVQQTVLDVRFVPSLSWRADSSEVLFGAAAVGAWVIGRYSLDGELEVVEVPIGTSGAAVVVEAGDVRLNVEAIGSQTDCQVPAMSPSGRTEPCSFRF